MHHDWHLGTDDPDGNVPAKRWQGYAGKPANQCALTQKAFSAHWQTLPPFALGIDSHQSVDPGPRLEGHQPLVAMVEVVWGILADEYASNPTGGCRPPVTPKIERQSFR